MRSSILSKLKQYFVRWWLYRYRLFSKPNTVTHEGVRLHLGNTAISKHIRKVVYRGGYENAEARMIRQTLEKDDRVLELGSGMGFIATFCARLLGKSDAVCAVEALPAMVPVIKENFRLNGVSPELIEAAVGLESGECTFTVAESFWSSSAAHSAGKGTTIAVPMVALRDLLDRFRPSYLVVDVEGMESTLFKQDLGTVLKICLEIHPHYVGDTGIRDCLLDLFNQGFVIDFLKSSRCVLFLYREAGDFETKS